MGEKSEKAIATIGQSSKEGGGGGSSSSILCPMLNNTNYTYWALRMRAALKVHKVWDIIEEEKVITDEEKNNMAVALLFQSIPEALALQVGEINDAKKLWIAIKTRHVGAERVREARLQTLMTEFDRLKMKDTETIDEFSGRVSEISSKSAALGTILEEPKLVKKFLKSLPRRKYIQIVASLEQVLDLSTTSFEDIVGHLKAYEERINEDEEPSEDQNKLMYANTDSQNSYSNQEYNGNYRGGYRGRGRGGRNSYRGRGRGGRGGRDMSEITCFRCDKNGHYAYLCPDRLLKLQESQESEKERDTEDADSLLMHEVVYLNEEKCLPSKFETNNDGEDIWYLDNGASNHMTGDKRYFGSLVKKISGS